MFGLKFFIVSQNNMALHSNTYKHYTYLKDSGDGVASCTGPPSSNLACVHTRIAQRMSAWSVSITSDWGHSHIGATVTAFLVLVNLWSLGQPVNDGEQSQIHTFLKGGKDSSCTCPSACISCFSSWPGAL